MKPRVKDSILSRQYVLHIMEHIYHKIKNTYEVSKRIFNFLEYNFYRGLRKNTSLTLYRGCNCTGHTLFLSL